MAKVIWEMEKPDAVQLRQALTGAKKFLEAAIADPQIKKAPKEIRDAQDLELKFYTKQINSLNAAIQKAK